MRLDKDTELVVNLYILLFDLCGNTAKIAKAMFESQIPFEVTRRVLFLKNGSVEFFGSHKDFFNQENLNRFYNNNLKILDSHLVVDL